MRATLTDSPAARWLGPVAAVSVITPAASVALQLFPPDAVTAPGATAEYPAGTVIVAEEMSTVLVRSLVIVRL